MFIFITCLCLAFSFQSNADVAYPTLGPVYGVPYNDSILNFTIVYPSNYQFDNLYARFSLYDFETTIQKPYSQPYLSEWANFTNSNTSYPWVAPSAPFGPGDYIIACFQWVQTDNSSNALFDVHQCILTRASLNSTRPAVDQMNITIPVVSNTTIIVNVYYPSALPYDVVNITSNLDGTIPPTTSTSDSNATYMVMHMYTYSNLIPNTRYNVCIYNQYQNTNITMSNNTDIQCRSITTSTAYRFYAILSNMMIILISITVARFI
ncbi:unnamed protein product [Adineta ricciae]|uniref:Uncharacterized protein n=1 Tax=Adineta ricciae TaxID=249248 RepID=A0A814UE49_ADIRI|nr:unnamed protein product [Adineta ricciae]CAF1175542.1 unnamed protein product [Adineta ricciae]